MLKALRLSTKILKWVAIISGSVICLLFLSMEGFDRYLSGDKGPFRLYEKIDQPKQLLRTTSGIRYLSLGDPQKPPLLLIHGAPGGLFDWLGLAKQEELYGHYRLLIVERPGYGDTQPRGAEPSIEIQAQRILEVLEKEAQAATVIGHSYGSPIALVLGAMAPQKIDHIFGLSGQYDPDNELIFKVSYWIKAPFFRWVLPRYIWVSNIEKLAHPDAQREILDLYPRIEVPVTLVHGNSDQLVPYENSTFVRDLMTIETSLITLEGRDHPIHMQEAEFLEDLLVSSGH